MKQEIAEQIVAEGERFWELVQPLVLRMGAVSVLLLIGEEGENDDESTT